MPDVINILNRYKELQTEKITWNSLYQTLGKYVRVTKQDFTSDTTPGASLVDDIFDSTGPQCNIKASAAFMGSLWPNGAKSIRITKPEGVKDSYEIKSYFEEVTKRLTEAMDNSRSGLVTALDEYSQDQMCFGICGVAVMEENDLDNPLSYVCWDIKSMCIDVNAKGFVDTVYNEQERTIKQVVEEYGFDNCSVKVRDLWMAKKYTDKIKVLYVIEPRLTRDITKQNNKNMPYISLHIDLDSKHIMKESGYMDMPVIVARFSKVPKEKYGRSPAMFALPDILELNAVREAYMLSIEKNLNPPLVVYDDGSLGGGEIDTSPGGINVISISGRISNMRPIEPIFTVGEMQSTKEHILGLEENISQHFYIDRLLDLNNETRMTFGEAQIRNKLRGASLASIYARQETEFFTPLIERSFNIMFRKKLLGVAKNSEEELMMVLMGEEPLIIPEAIIGKLNSGREAYKIQYISPAKRIMQAEEVQGIMTTWEFVGNLAKVAPDLLDNLDSDKTVRRLAELTGVPDELLRDNVTMNNIREMRNQQQQLLMQIQAERMQSETSRNTAQANATGG